MSLTLTQILTNATTTTTGTGSSVGAALKGPRSWQVNLSGTGAVTATVNIQVSLTGGATEYLTLVAFTLTGSALVVDGAVTEGAWGYARATVTALTGTGATVNVWMGT